ncbi:hypothetical protein AKJ65_06335 [candidate division MSBL1 archaeon SCGC-AAA259E19]|uniref:Uncharacterized protein n=1 Tax=candidate division MSBL1 archaeon SCGC-AAA259E19 TaxID=1698264 RepID=A0A133UH62_9EURY|nr:hypothetical protein AKJ65_06335 [candidate division MSBL1 archaeon SCGC-AAA259E19]
MADVKFEIQNIVLSVSYVGTKLNLGELAGLLEEERYDPSVKARDLLGEEYEQNFLKISCSDEGVLERKKTLPGEGGGEIQRAKRRARGSGSDKRLRLRREFLRHIESPPIGDVPHKILYLMDFDQEDSKAQNSLRRPMENYSDNCRFILAASDTSNIITPLKSRCAILRFGGPPEGESRI